MAHHQSLSWRLLPRHPATARGAIKLSLITHCWGNQFPNTFTIPGLSYCGSNTLSLLHQYMGRAAAFNNLLLCPSILGQHFRIKGTERARKSATKAEGCNTGHGWREMSKPRKHPGNKWLSSQKGMGETGTSEVVSKQNELSKALLRKNSDLNTACSLPGPPLSSSTTWQQPSLAYYPQRTFLKLATLRISTAKHQGDHPQPTQDNTNSPLPRAAHVPSSPVHHRATAVLWQQH